MNSLQIITRLCRHGIYLLVFISGAASSQNILSDIDHDARDEYDRMIILSGGGDPLLHTSISPFLRGDLVILADSFSRYSTTSKDNHQILAIWDENNEFVKPGGLAPSMSIQYVDSSNTFYYLHEEPGLTRYRLSKHPLWKTFYRTPAHFYEVDVKDFYLRVDPLIHFGGGCETNDGITTFTNQRGLSMRGAIGQNVFFQTSIYDSQVRYANYINRFTDSSGVVPGAGFYKNYVSSFLKTTNGRDFLLATAYVGVNLGKYIGFQLGHGQQFIGDGIRSLFLSDFSPPYFSLKINTRIWKFHYQNIFAELAADDFRSVSGKDEPVPKKYLAAHYLSFKPGRNFSISLFEAVVFDRPGHQFELQYLNPIILYRTVEGTIGSPDNVILGLNARANIKKTISAYGQFVLDDIQIGQILDGHLDWWGNKFGHQLGIKYINAFGVNSFDAQLEWNQIRPYTYSHYNKNANYSNYKQALAHPLGANFNEWIISIRYRVSDQLKLESNIYLIKKGEDIDSISYGGDINVANIKRPADYGHTIGEGVATDIVFWTSSLQYELSPGLFVDLQYLLRKKTSDILSRKLNTNLFQLGVRLNMAKREDVF
ncbi:MAG TPA: capsule assembly Wzi family protein [Saprospiraceae bacterium]|nr:capsule assembly Wzi family protein [Saprospiraceae bacterium]